jgi:Protein of unknown function (DUF3616)
MAPPSLAAPSHQRRLHLGDEHDDHTKALRDNLSGLAGVDGWLWLAGDEGRRLLRLQRGADGTYGHPQWIQLCDYGLAGGHDDGESDLEGLCVDGQRLWLVGSHSLRRTKHNSTKGTPLEVEARRRPNTQVLGCLNLDRDGNPCSGQRLCIDNTIGEDALTTALAAQPLLRPFLPIPSKDNGLDIEGITARDDRVLLGLRGPVLRGIALVADVTLSGLEPHHGSDAIGNPLELAHLRLCGLDLGGLAVRDLAVLPGSDDVLILAGPTMTLAGPCQLYRWRNAFATGDAACEGLSVTTPTPVLWIRDGSPHERHNKPEGLDLERIEGHLVAWIAYDNPDKHRCRGAGCSTQLDGFVLGVER